MTSKIGYQELHKDWTKFVSHSKPSEDREVFNAVNLPKSKEKGLIIFKKALQKLTCTNESNSCEFAKYRLTLFVAQNDGSSQSAQGFSGQTSTGRAS